MDEVRRIIKLISGRNHKACYQELLCAIGVALEALPDHPPMKAIQSEVVRRMDKKVSSGSVSRALSRAAEDIWLYGNRDNLEHIFARPLREQPTAKSLIFTIAEYIRNTAKEAVLYSLWPSLLPHRHGIIGQSPHQGIAVSPVDMDLKNMILLIQYLNRNQIPLDVFLEHFLSRTDGEDEQPPG